MRTRSGTMRFQIASQAARARSGRSGLAVTLCVGVSLLLAGCADRQLMSPPIIAQEMRPSIYEVTEPDRRTLDVPIWIATNRVEGMRDPDRPKWFYGTGRARRIRLARATVDIGEKMSWNELVVASSNSDRDREPVVRPVRIEEFGDLWMTLIPPGAPHDPTFSQYTGDRGPSEAFAREINEHLEGAPRRDINIFVHGFNSRVYSTLQFGAGAYHYYGRRGPWIMFEWPSRGSIFKYTQDKMNAGASIRSFRVFLEFLARNTEAEEINIYAHSAGGELAASTLAEIGLMDNNLSRNEVLEKWKLGRVVLAAPDMDLQLMGDFILDGLDFVCDRLSIYTSSSDKALSISDRLWGFSRLGNFGGEGFTPEEADSIQKLRDNIEFIDVANAQENVRAGGLGHSYYHENPWVFNDVLLTAVVGTGPADRGLVRDTNGIWQFPEDYVSRISEIVSDIMVPFKPRIDEINAMHRPMDDEPLRRSSESRAD